MALTAYGKNEALKGASEQMKWLGAFTSKIEALTSNTASGSSVLNQTSTPLVNGNIVVFRKLTGSVTNLKENRPYFVVGKATNTFEVALEEGGTGLKVEGHTLETGSTELALLTEVATTEGYARKEAKFGSPSEGKKIEATGTVTLENLMPSITITDLGWWQTETGQGSGKRLEATAKLTTAESYGAAKGKLEVTADKVEWEEAIA